MADGQIGAHARGLGIESALMNDSRAAVDASPWGPAVAAEPGAHMADDHLASHRSQKGAPAAASVKRREQDVVPRRRHTISAAAPAPRTFTPSSAADGGTLVPQVRLRVANATALCDPGRRGRR
ncbi:hypothetical protein Tdes44962_MAKER08530 [Teratosphaeria destructans]|uniref:Uncharacterized protein n=1 Tax=Teratosphaeria destructans TaxID=418781 RepID=A0A9W7W4U3_9PEZI|nr:hypothetical protein Tdes44962_MAKER08530 [Teratosphaeria destructans]